MWDSKRDTEIKNTLGDSVGEGVGWFERIILKHVYSVQFSSSVVSDSLRPHEPQHTRPPFPSPTSGVHPNPCPLSWWCHPTISSSVVPFSSCPQSFPASGSFIMSHLFTSCDQIIGVSASTYYHKWNRSPVQVWCMRKGTQGPCIGMTLREGMWRPVGGGFSMGDTCTSMANLHHEWQKPLQYCKVISLQLN